MSTSSRILTSAVLAIAFLAFGATQAQATSIAMTLLGDFCGGSVSSGSSCVQLGDRYDVTGGGVVDPAKDKFQTYLTPGSFTGDPR